MNFRLARQFLALSVALIFAAQISAQSENLSARLIIKKTDAEIAEILNNKTETELKGVCDELLKQASAPEIAADPSSQTRVVRLSLDTARKIHYVHGEARALLNLGFINNRSKQPAAALEYFEQAVTVAEKSGDSQLRLVILGGVSYTTRISADYEQSLDFGTRALKVCEELKDTLCAVRELNGIGATNMLRGDYNAAEAAHRRALKLSEQIKNREETLNSLFHLGIVNRLRGNYADALRLYQEAKDMSDSFAAQKPDIFPSATILRHIAGTYFLQGNLRLALDYTNQARALDERRGDNLGLAYSLQMTGLIRVAEKNYAAALPLVEQTVPMFEKSNDNDGLARSLTLLGNIYAAIGENDKALENLYRALVMREASGSRDGTANVRIAIARVLLTQGKYADALALAEKAAASGRENGNRELLWQAQSLTGQIYLAENECAKTRTAFDAAIGTIESLRGEIVGGASENSLFFAERTKPYQMLAAMLAKETDFNAAFEYAERAKARVLLDAARFGRNQQTAILTTEEHAEENRLRGDVSSLNAQISKVTGGDTAKISGLKEKLETVRTALARFQTNLYAKHPELRIKRGAVKPIEIGEVGNLLDDQSALLEYLVADDAVLLFVFTKTGSAIEFKTYRITVKRGELSDDIRRFRRMLADRNVLFAAEARKLYAALLQPAAQQITDKTKLLIIPDDGLWELPFQALQASENHYVLDDASVAYAPSLTFLRELRGRQNAANSKLTLAFGNPTERTAKILDANFAALPEAEKQTLALKNLYGAETVRVFNRADADEGSLKRVTANGFSMLHLATHGILDNNSPLNSYVLLAPNQETGDDGRLEAWEILEMDLKSDLVMLSACETARGQARSGEGLIGLAWSLMVAGARNVAVSQWKVEAASTTALTVEFYKNLKQSGGANKSEALRQAELKLRRNPATAHPFYWAGFALIGEGK